MAIILKYDKQIGLLDFFADLISKAAGLSMKLVQRSSNLNVWIISAAEWSSYIVIPLIRYRYHTFFVIFLLSTTSEIYPILVFLYCSPQLVLVILHNS